jgi:UDP-N-acetylmuramoyl-tripeptide--D-alanyl-D-alanine ligase
VQVLTLHELLEGSGGRLYGSLPDDTTFPRVELDPGKVRPRDLFVAVPGEHVDGHEFVVVAAVRGATAALVSRTWATNVREHALPVVVVDDEPLAAVQRVAAARRRRLQTTVVGITGSVGKTSTKEVVATVLAQRFATYRSPGNRNNEIGLPLALLEVDPRTEVAVLEMGGAYAFGELALLAQIAKPSIGVVTNVRPVHIERMRSLAAIARTKAELIDALPAHGIAVLNGDDERVRTMGVRCAGGVLTFGRGKGNEVRATAVVSMGLDGCSFTVDLDGTRRSVRVPLLGPHAVELTLAGLAVGHALGIGLDVMIPALAGLSVDLRLRRVRGINNCIVIDDTYNASTAGVLSALTLIGDARPDRAIAVLGDMNELGSLSDREHRTVGRHAAKVADLLVTYGELARTIADEASSCRQGERRPAVVSFDPSQRRDLIEFLQGEIRPGDVVLVKGSRALRMEEFVAALTESA